MQTTKERNKELKHYFWCKLKQDAEVVFKRTITTDPEVHPLRRIRIHHVVGKVVKVRKTSVRLLTTVEDEGYRIDIGFRNILHYE